VLLEVTVLQKDLRARSEGTEQIAAVCVTRHSNRTGVADLNDYGDGGGGSLGHVGGLCGYEVER
jgi:hypothetical protein